MKGEKYTSAFLRKLEGTDAKGRKILKAWQGVLKYKEPNPDYVEPPEDGEDARTAKQKRREVWRQVTNCFDPDEVRTKSQATKALESWRAEMESKAAQPDNAGVTVPEYLDSFLASWERNIEASTQKDYQNVGKRIKAAFADVPLRDLTGKMVTAWVDSMHKSGLSAATQRKSYALLNLMCKQAVKADDLDANPCDKADAPKSPKADPNPLTDKSLATLLRLLDGMEPTPLCVAVYMGVYMGLREGETCALQWKHIDFDGKTATVCQAIGRGTGKQATYVKTPKNARSMRVLPIPSPMLDVLAARRDRMAGELAGAGIELDPEEFGELFVIGAIDGRYQNPNTLCRQWHNVAEAFDLVGTKGRLCTLYDATRHVYATKAVARGIDVNSIASYLGHDPTVTLRVYADADANAKRAAADAMATVYDTPAK